VGIVEPLLRYGAMIDAIDKDGMTPLMHGSKRGHAAVIELLLENGADKEMKNAKGKTAKDYAMKSMKYETQPKVKELLSLLEDGWAEIGDGEDTLTSSD
jgi:ankyrin repeat protein